MILISVNNSLSYSLSAIISIKSFGEEFTSCITVLVCYQYINLCSSLSAVFPLLTLNLAHISCNDAPRWTTAFPILYNSFHLGYGQKARSDVGHNKEGFLFYLQNHECESLCSQARLTLLNSITSSASCVCLFHPKAEASESTWKFPGYPCTILDERFSAMVICVIFFGFPFCCWSVFLFSLWIM